MTNDYQRYFEEIEIGEEYIQTQQPTRENVLEFLGTWSDPGDEVRGRFQIRQLQHEMGCKNPSYLAICQHR